MLIVPKKDNTPRRVVDFSNLNKLCKRNAETTSDTNRIATSVPTPKPGEKLFFSTMDAWNGYHSVPLEESAKKYFGFLTQWGTFRYRVVPQGFIGSGDHYVSVYNDIMNQLKEKEKSDPNSVFRCLATRKSNGPTRAGNAALTTPYYGPRPSNKVSYNAQSISHFVDKPGLFLKLKN